MDMKFFSYDHLPDKLKKVSEPFCELACQINESGGNFEEREACLRKLLEAKDCAVRAIL